MPEISIAVPVFNGEAYIAQSLACIEGQTFGDFEAIILDNCSTDSTREIVQSFVDRDPRFRLIVQPFNKGAMPNYTDGFRAAKSEFFMWRAFDDLSDPAYLETLRNTLIANPQAGLATGRIRMVNMDGSNERLIEFPHMQGTELTDIFRLMFQSHAGWFYGLWRRDMLEKSFLKTMDMCPHTWGNDHLILLPFLLSRGVVFAPKALFHQRLKKVKGGPKTPSRVAWRDMRSTRRDFARCYAMNIDQHSRAKSFSAIALRAAMFAYREKRSYRIAQVAKAFFRDLSV